MRHPQILEWAVWATLDNYRHEELILLKGHLLLEVALFDALVGTGTLTPKAAKSMSFSQKLNELETLAVQREALLEPLNFARQLNRLRNKLAHEPFHEADGEELSNWAKSVLTCMPSHKYQKYTPRTRLTQAIASVARAFFECSAA